MIPTAPSVYKPSEPDNRMDLPNPPSSSPPAPRRARILIGALLAVVLAYQWQQRSQSDPRSTRPRLVRVAQAAEAVGGTIDRGRFAQVLRERPLDALEWARANHLRNVADYRCTFVKQELLFSGMSREQIIDVRFRQQPYSVMMHWVHNPDKAVRVIYVAGRWVDPQAERLEERDLAVCQPGAIAQLFVRSIRQPIRGVRAREASRRPIDDFGFARSLELIVEFSRKAEQNGHLDLRFAGEAEFDGRPVWKLERFLPNYGANGPYPDASAVYFIDQEWLVPVAVYSFADAGQSQMLGRYEYRDVRMNAGCGESDFDPASYGM